MPTGAWKKTPDLEGDVRAVTPAGRAGPRSGGTWERTREWSLEGFRQMYAALDVRFDKYYFNSQEEKPGKAIVEELCAAESPRTNARGRSSGGQDR